MKKQLFMLLALLFNMCVSYGQEYTYPFNQVTDPFADGANHFDLEPFFDKASQLYGYKKDGKVVIDAAYDFTQGFSEKGIARVTNKIPGSNVMISPLMSGGYFGMNLTFDNDGLNGFIDQSGKVVIPIKYSVLGLLELYKVVPFGIKKEVNGEEVVKFGLINDSGDIVMDAKYDHIYQQGKIYFATIFKPNYNEICYLDDTGKELGKGGKFDTFKVVSNIPPYVFYAEHQGTAYLINEDFYSLATPTQINNNDSNGALQRLTREYNYRYKPLNYENLKIELQLGKAQ